MSVAPSVSGVSVVSSVAEPRGRRSWVIRMKPSAAATHSARSAAPMTSPKRLRRGGGSGFGGRGGGGVGALFVSCCGRGSGTGGVGGGPVGGRGEGTVSSGCWRGWGPSWCRSAMRSSIASAKRSSGFVARQRPRIALTCAACGPPYSGGGPCSRSRISSMPESVTNGGRWCSIVQSTHPSAYTSPAGVATLPACRSGGMYGRVPITAPPVSVESMPWVRAIPKSASSARSPSSSAESRMFDGLISRCTMPRWCAAARPVASCPGSLSASHGSKGRASTRVCRSPAGR